MFPEDFELSVISIYPCSDEAGPTCIYRNKLEESVPQPINLQVPLSIILDPGNPVCQAVCI